MTNLLILADSFGDSGNMSAAFKDAFGGYGIISLIVAGIVLGFLAKLLIPGDQKIGFILTIVSGIIGAGIGNVVSALVGVKHTEGIDWLRHGFQVVGAIIVVLIVSAIWAKIRGGSKARA